MVIGLISGNYKKPLYIARKLYRGALYAYTTKSPEEAGSDCIFFLIQLDE